MSQKIIAVILILVVLLGGGYLVYKYVYQPNIVPPAEENGNNNNPPIDDQPLSCADQAGNAMLFDDALVIAQSSSCAAEGSFKESKVCNDATGTWWIDLEPNELKEGCNPACVIDIATQAASINWRCTGLIEP